MLRRTCFLNANAAILLFVLPALTGTAVGEDSKPTLVVVDRSMTADGLYQCSLHLPKDYPIESIGLVLYDRKKSKSGEALLATTPTPAGKVAFFFLNHELVKHSVLHVHAYPLDDERHTQLKFVVGDRPAVRKENGKTIEVPIE